jgi:hypothetical protein
MLPREKDYYLCLYKMVFKFYFFYPILWQEVAP